MHPPPPPPFTPRRICLVPNLLWGLQDGEHLSVAEAAIYPTAERQTLRPKQKNRDAIPPEGKKSHGKNKHTNVNTSKDQRFSITVDSVKSFEPLQTMGDGIFFFMSQQQQKKDERN